MRLRTIKQSEESTPRILPPDVRILPPAAMARPKVSSLLEVLVESVDSDCGLLLELAAAVGGDARERAREARELRLRHQRVVIRDRIKENYRLRRGSVCRTTSGHRKKLETKLRALVATRRRSRYHSRNAQLLRA